MDVQQTQKNIDDQIRMCNLNITKYEKLCDNITAQAKEALRAKNKKQATLLMKKRKMYEKEMSKLEGMQMFMEQQKLTMESNLNNANIMSVMHET